LIRCFREICYK